MLLPRTRCQLLDFAVSGTLHPTIATNFGLNFSPAGSCCHPKIRISLSRLCWAWGPSPQNTGPSASRDVCCRGPILSTGARANRTPKYPFHQQRQILVDFTPEFSGLGAELGHPPKYGSLLISAPELYPLEMVLIHPKMLPPHKTYTGWFNPPQRVSSAGKNCPPPTKQ